MRREPLHGDSGLHTPADRASPFEHTRAHCERSELGSCSSADDGLARPSEAADAAERSERACRCYRRIGSSTLDGRGQQGVGCSCVAAIDVARQLCAAGQQAGLGAIQGPYLEDAPLGVQDLGGSRCCRSTRCGSRHDS